MTETRTPDEKTNGANSTGVESTDDAADAAQIAAMEREIARLAEGFCEWAIADLDAACSALQEAHTNAESREAALKTLYGHAHTLKGQGGCFDYPLVTEIGQSLCQYLRQVSLSTDEQFGIARFHLAAIRRVLEKQITGTGEDVGRKLIARLNSMVNAEVR